jgi:hypothetical protein
MLLLILILLITVTFSTPTPLITRPTNRRMEGATAPGYNRHPSAPKTEFSTLRLYGHPLTLLIVPTL